MYERRLAAFQLSEDSLGLDVRDMRIARQNVRRAPGQRAIGLHEERQEAAFQISERLHPYEATQVAVILRRTLRRHGKTVGR